MTRDLTPDELRYADRDVLAERLRKVQSERAKLAAELEALRDPQRCGYRDDPGHDHEQCLDDVTRGPARSSR